VLAGAVTSIAISAGPAPPATVAAALGLDGDDAVAELDRRRDEAIAVLTARCMVERGQRYVPVPAPAPAVPDADLAPVAWAARWGFGVSTSVGRGSVAAAPDPNRAHAASLSVTAERRYRAALYGGNDGPGCAATATDRVMGLRDRLLAPLREELAALDRTIDADPLVRAATLAWRRCVSGPARIRDADPGALGPRLAARFGVRLAGATGWRALMLLQAEERSVATAVARCDAELVAARAIAAAPHEARFVRRHGPQLRAIGTVIGDLEAALPTLPP
jgi:hypothetical protein